MIFVKYILITSAMVLGLSAGAFAQKGDKKPPPKDPPPVINPGSKTPPPKQPEPKKKPGDFAILWIREANEVA